MSGYPFVQWRPICGRCANGQHDHGSGGCQNATHDGQQKCQCSQDSVYTQEVGAECLLSITVAHLGNAVGTGHPGVAPSPSNNVPPHLTALHERCCTRWPHDLTIPCQQQERESAPVTPSMPNSELSVPLCRVPLGGPSALHSALSEAGELDAHIAERHPEYGESESEPECPACGHLTPHDSTRDSGYTGIQTCGPVRGIDGIYICSCRREFRDRALQMIARAATSAREDEKENWREADEWAGDAICKLQQRLADSEIQAAKRIERAETSVKEWQRKFAEVRRQFDEQVFRCIEVKVGELLAARRPVVTPEARERIVMYVRNNTYDANDDVMSWEDCVKHTDQIIAIITGARAITPPDGVTWDAERSHYKEEVCLGCRTPIRLRDCGCPAGTGWREWKPRAATQ